MNRQRTDNAKLGAVAGAGAAGLYLLFVGQAGWHESVCAAAVAVLAGAYTYAVARVARRHLALRPALLREIARGVGSMPADMVRVGRVLLHALVRRPAGPVGTIERRPLRGSVEGADAGWRAAAGIGMSLAPNGYLVDVSEDGVALIHRLAAAGASR